MSDNKMVWSDTEGDLRKKKSSSVSSQVDEKNMILKVRRLTSGKGRTVIEISALPKNKKWCQDLAKSLKKSLGVGGTYKNDYIEIHGEKIDLVTAVLDKKNLKWKKTGG
jgi:translation initiation factor 1